MLNGRNSNRGFIGLLALLIAVAGIIFFIVRTDLFTGGKMGGNSTDQGIGLEGNNMIEQGQSAINKAKDAKALLEENSRKTTEEGQ